MNQAIEKEIFTRFEISNSSARLISGDNRTLRFLNAYAHLNTETFLWGLDWLCAVNQPKCEMIYGPMGENPLWPIISRGIFVSWPYYFITFLFLAIGIKRKNNLAFFGFGLLFLQRPYIMLFGYSFMASLPLYYYYNVLSLSRRKQ